MTTTLQYSPTRILTPPRIFEWISRMVRSAANRVKQDPQKILLYNSAVRDYSTMIERICFGYSNTAEDLADLKQDSLLNLWESMPLYKGECSMKTWVYRITLNSCVSSMRKSYRRVSTVQLTALYDIVDYDEERKQIIADLHETIASLNPIDKAIMLLWLEEVSYEEIAKITGIAISNVGVRIHRAKSKLKQFSK